jgi:predicted alpha/beta-fold hydrolase
MEDWSTGGVWRAVVSEEVERARSFRVRPFEPAWWAAGPHLQTIAGRFMRPELELPLERERWDTPDGDFIDLDFSAEPETANGSPAPLVLLLHGLEGSARRAYAMGSYLELARRGVRAVGLNFRSCSGEPNRLPRAYHSGDTADLSFVLRRLQERFPGRPLGALGFSLGGNVLLKLLGERGAHAPVAAAAAVSVPYDLAAGAKCLEISAMGRLYAWHFLRMLRRKVHWKSSMLRERIALEAVLAARTLREFDDLATAPLHGFRDADHYYGESSSARFLTRIVIPTLLIHALDDPFQPREHVPFDAIEENPALIPAFVDQGGHVGFVEGAPRAPSFWAEEQAARFLASALGGRADP